VEGVFSEVRLGSSWVASLSSGSENARRTPVSEGNKAIVRRWVQAFNEGNVDAVDELVTDSYVRHDPNSPEVRGPEQEKQLIAMYRSAFPDLHFTIEDMVAEGDKVVIRVAIHATHEGELLGIPPTEKQLTFTSTEIFRLAEGKIDEQWVNFDALGMMQQLGAIPEL
jgi:steroid delta-isomerase-like uncharacterized protein